jgi:ketosteroid isomerase-like protein
MRDYAIGRAFVDVRAQRISNHAGIATYFPRIIPERARRTAWAPSSSPARPPSPISCRRRPERPDSVKRLSAWCGFLLIAAATAVSAQPAGEAEAAIRNALSRWTSDFNAGDGARICDLFAKDLLYDYRGFPERDYESLCSLLRRSLADRTKQFAYSLDIKEIIVAGDLAAVRLVWTLKMTVPGAAKAVDGSWKIVRYIAYEEP